MAPLEAEDGAEEVSCERLSSREWSDEADMGAIFGLDAGGSLAKLVYFEKAPGPEPCSRTIDHQQVKPPAGLETASSLPQQTLKRVRSLQLLDSPVCTATLRKFYDFMRQQGGNLYISSAVHEAELSFYSPSLGGHLHFMQFETKDLDRVLLLLQKHKLHHTITRLGCTGGGSYKYKAHFEHLDIEVVPIDEMEGLVRGLELVVSNVVGECYTYVPRLQHAEQLEQKEQQEQQQEQRLQGQQELGQQQRRRRPPPPASPPPPPPSSLYGKAPRSSSHGCNFEPREGDCCTPSSSLPLPLHDVAGPSTPDPPSLTGAKSDWDDTVKARRPSEAVRGSFPYLLVSIGSGVSIIRVDAPGVFTRVSGSSIGGGTFFGLARLITGCRHFDEVLALAERGDSTKCDMLVGDIYGRNYTRIGLASDVVASSFGKMLAASDPEDSRPEDRARALLMMVTNNIGQVAYLNAVQQKTSRIYFVGNFLRSNQISCRRLSYAIKYWSGGDMEALFLEHEGYFGCLGAFILSAQAGDETETEAAGWSPPSSPRASAKGKVPTAKTKAPTAPAAS